tara:strand:+ start:2815 stop:3333 length:519 start_codon:yes stop_codon:yes gene_type:complete
MVADRISLVKIYNALLPINESDGEIDSILLHRKTEFGVKTVPRFNSIQEFKEFIEKLYPYNSPNDCKCLTKNEGVYEILNFSFVDAIGDTTYVNNLPDYFQTSKPQNINELHFNGLNNVKQSLIDLSSIYNKYVCYPYIEYGYLGCDYIEIIRNQSYTSLIEIYKNTQYIDA